jgi:cytochrome c
MLKFFCTWVVALTALTGIANAQDAHEKAKKGAAAYQLCAACHSLQPGVHLSGPSLANLWGKRVATISDFGRYTDALKKTEIVWDENTLYAWVADPQAMVPGTTMTFRGVQNDGTRANLIAFQMVGMSPLIERRHPRWCRIAAAGLRSLI